MLLLHRGRMWLHMWKVSAGRAMAHTHFLGLPKFHTQNELKERTSSMYTWTKLHVCKGTPYMGLLLLRKEATGQILSTLPLKLRSYLQVALLNGWHWVNSGCLWNECGQNPRHNICFTVCAMYRPYFHCLHIMLWPFLCFPALVTAGPHHGLSCPSTFQQAYSPQPKHQH